jgi:hypothetical protein
MPKETPHRQTSPPAPRGGYTNYDRGRGGYTRGRGGNTGGGYARGGGGGGYQQGYGGGGYRGGRGQQNRGGYSQQTMPMQQPVNLGMNMPFGSTHSFVG